jgi:PAS domain S-box-containing protein
MEGMMVWGQYFEIILLVYSFSFVVLSIVIYVLPGKGRQSCLLENLPLFALFGLLHGIHEFIDWSIFRHTPNDDLLYWVSAISAAASYLMLAEFDRRMFFNRSQSIFCSSLFFYAVIGTVFLFFIFVDNTVIDGITVASRFFIGFPGAVAAGFLIFGFSHQQNYSELKHCLQVAGGCLIGYGISTLFLSDDHSLFSQKWLTHSWFLATFKLPIQLVRAFFILVTSISIIYTVRNIGFHNRQRELATLNELNQFNENLEARVKNRTEKLHQLIKKLRTDINERKEIEKQLRLTRERWKFALEGAGEGVWDYNFETEEAFYSKRYREMYGLVEDENGNVDHDWKSCVHPEDMPKVRKKLADYLKGKTDVFFVEYRMLCKDGNWKWVLDRGMLVSRTKDGKPLRMIGTHLDITEHKQMELSLKASKAFAASILDSLAAHIAVLNRQGIIMTVNRAWQQFAAQNGGSSNMLGDNYLEVCAKAVGHPLSEGVEEMLCGIKAVIAGELPEFHTEYPCHSPDEQRWFYVTVLPLQDDNQGVVISHENITERKKLALEKEQYFKFFNFARDLQCIASLDGYFKQVNPVCCEVLGYSKEELLTKSFIEFVIPEDRQPTLNEIQKQVNNSVTLGFENRYLRRDGSICWLSWNAFLNPEDQLMYAVARDVTETKKNQEKLLLADLVYQNSIEGILVTDENNQIISVNPAFTDITGYTFDDVAGRTPSMFKSGRHDQDFYRTMWQELIEKGKWQGEIWDRRKNGEHHAKFLNINIIRNQNGLTHRYLAIFSDITARKQYEEEIKRLSESELNKAKLEAEKASKAKSEFLSSMSHELRTPMNAVLGFAQLLELEDLTEEQSDSVHEILTAGHHLLDLINQVLDLSKIEAEKLEIKLEKIALFSVIQHCINLIKPLQSKYQVEIINDTDNCQCTVIADTLHLKQVLLNLFSNAVKYNQPHGNVTIFCDRWEQTVRINVVDTGKGLSAAQLAKLFQPFERLSAKNSHIEGSGIGLVITKKLVEAMDGKIGVSSTVGEGCCFWVEIPLSASE